MGETISVSASLTDSYSSYVTGIAEQLSVAINAAGISGVTASASSGAITVNTKPVFSNVSVLLTRVQQILLTLQTAQVH